MNLIAKAYPELRDLISEEDADDFAHLRLEDIWRTIGQIENSESAHFNNSQDCVSYLSTSE
jgi:hypothetical protein